MADRYATIIKDNDGKEVVSVISQMEGNPPEVRENAPVRVQKVPDGVKIGMVRGGPVDSVAGFGFPEGTPSQKVEKPKAINNDPDNKVRAEPSKASAKA